MLLETSLSPTQAPMLVPSHPQAVSLESICLIQLAPPVIRLLRVRNPRSDQKASCEWHGLERAMRRRGSTLGAICSSSETSGRSLGRVPCHTVLTESLESLPLDPWTHGAGWGAGSHR